MPVANDPTATATTLQDRGIRSQLIAPQWQRPQRHTRKPNTVTAWRRDRAPDDRKGPVTGGGSHPLLAIQQQAREVVELGGPVM